VKAQSIHEAYRSLLTELRSGTDLFLEKNRRTGVDVVSIPGGWSFKLSLLDGRLPVPGNRRYFPPIAAAETAWQLMGTKDPAWVNERAPKLWSDFVEEDGSVRAAYGYRWRVHFGRDQLQMAISALNRDPTDRRVFVSTWDPSQDGLGQEGQPRNVPCITGFSLTRTGSLLHASVFLRSSDVFVGLPYDIMNYALLLDAAAATLDCVPATLHFTLAHAHLYEPHRQAVFQCIHGSHADWMKAEDVSPQLPAWSLESIQLDPQGYLNHVQTLTGRVRKHAWSVQPELVK